MNIGDLVVLKQIDLLNSKKPYYGIITALDRTGPSLEDVVEVRWLENSPYNMASLYEPAELSVVSKAP
jgi:hypothetical protein